MIGYQFSIMTALGMGRGDRIAAAFGPLMDWTMPVLLRGGRLVIGSSRRTLCGQSW